MTSSRVTADSIAVRTTPMSGKGATGAFGEKGPRAVGGAELVRRFGPGPAGTGDGPAPCLARPPPLDCGDALALAAAALAALDAGVGTFAGGGGGPP